MSLLVSLWASHFKVEPAKYLLTILGIALGVAVFVSIRTANKQAVTDFKVSNDLMAGSRSLTVSSLSGSVPEELFTKLSGIQGIKRVLPKSIAYASLTDELGKVTRSVQVVGLDILQRDSFKLLGTISSDSYLKLFSHPLSGLFSSGLLEPGKTITLLTGSKEVEIRSLGSLATSGIGGSFGGNTIVIDIAWFQELFDSIGLVQQFDLHLEESLSKEREAQLMREVEDIIPESAFAEANNSRNDQAKNMFKAFQINLSFMAAISLLLATLLVYQVSSYLIIRRRTEYSVLLSLGMTTKSLFFLVLGEIALLGVIGSVLGSFLGGLLASQAVDAVRETISNLYVPAVPAATSNSFLSVEGIALGIAASILGAWIPCKKLLTLSIRENLRATKGKSISSATRKKLIIAAAILLIASYFTCSPFLFRQTIFAAFIPPTLLLLSSLLIAPLILWWFCSFFKSHSNLISFRLASEHLLSTPWRSSISISTVAISLGLFIGLSVLITSFRISVYKWVHHITTADVYISAGDSMASSMSVLDRELVDSIKGLEEVSSVDLAYSQNLVLRGRTVRSSGVDFSLIETHNRLLFKNEGSNSNQSDFLGVYISEPLSKHLRIDVGEELQIPTSEGFEKVIVEKVFYDFTSDLGLILFPTEEYKTLFKKKLPVSASLYLKENQSTKQLIDYIEKQFPLLRINVRDSTELRDEVLTIFDKTFSVTYALQGISILVSALVLLNSALILAIERRREFSTLRSIGASKELIRKLASAECLTMSLGASFLGMLIGLGLSLILVFFVNKQFFGWSVSYALEFTEIALVTIATTLIGAAMGYLSLTDDPLEANQNQGLA